MKQCSKCNVNLIAGENWSTSRASNKSKCPVKVVRLKKLDCGNKTIHKN
jgi:hypothetical protein